MFQNGIDHINFTKFLSILSSATDPDPKGQTPMRGIKELARFSNKVYQLFASDLNIKNRELRGEESKLFVMLFLIRNL